ncbi:MAG: hypothetical protein ACFB00_09675, partial [Parvularculaceae bacterium]
MKRASKESKATASRLVREAWSDSKPGLGAIAVFSVFVNLMKLTVPLFVLQTLDRVTASRSVVTLVMLASITLVAAGAGAQTARVGRAQSLKRGGGGGGGVG